jgi:hypothetical protein
MDNSDSLIDAIRAQNISDSSKEVYISSSTRFLKWIIENRPNLANLGFVVAVTDENGQLSNDLIKKYLVSTQELDDPINFDEITVRDFLSWIISLRVNGKSPSTSSFSGHRSAFFNLFRIYKKTMSRELETELKVHFKGLKRKSVLETVQGDSSLHTGKAPLSFEMYNMLAGALMKGSGSDFAFSHCFLLICWNLMCRASNAFAIRFSHMRWNDDSLCIYFAHSKTDQLGERPRDPRHIYSNPLNPTICPILSLGLYFISASFDPNSSALFPGSNQYERYDQNFLVIKI